MTLLRWFNLNSLTANSGNFQSIILEKFPRPKHCLAIGLINVKESDHVEELLGITIDKHLTLQTLIHVVCL